MLKISVRDSSKIISFREIYSAKIVVANENDFNIEITEDLIRERMAKKNWPETTLEAFITTDAGRQIELAGSDNYPTRFFLAQNPNLNPDVQYALTKDKTTEVRESLAKNKNLTEKVQKKLSNDKTDVKVRLAKNPNLLESIQIKMLEKAKDKRNRSYGDNVVNSLRDNPGLGLNTLKILLDQLSYYDKANLFKTRMDTESQKVCYEDVQGRTSRYHNPLNEFLSNTPFTPEMEQLVVNDVVNLPFDEKNKEESIKAVSELLKNQNISPSTEEALYKKFGQDKEIASTLASKTKNPKIQLELYNNGYTVRVAKNPNLNKSVALDIIGSGDFSLVKEICEHLLDKENPDKEILNTLLATNSYAIYPLIIDKLDQTTQDKLIDDIREGLKAGEVTEKYVIDLADSLNSEKDKISQKAQFFILEYAGDYYKNSLIKKTKYPEVQMWAYKSGDENLIQKLYENENLDQQIKTQIISNAKTVPEVNGLSKLNNLTPNEMIFLFNKAIELKDSEPIEPEKGPWYNSSGSEYAINELAEKVSLPEVLQKAIIDSKYYEALSNLAQNKGLLKSLQIPLAKLNEEYVQQKLANREDLLPELQNEFAKNSMWSVKRNLQKNDYVEKDVKEYLDKVMKIKDELEDEDEGMQLTEETEFEILNMHDNGLDFTLSRKSIYPSILFKLLSSTNSEVVDNVSTNKYIDENTQKAIFEKNDKNLDDNLVSNKKVNPNIKQEIFQRYKGTETGQTIAKKLVEQGYADKDLQLEFYESTKGHEYTSYNKSQKLFTDEFNILIRTKNLLPEIQIELAKRKDVKIRERLAENENLIIEVQNLLAADKFMRVREKLAENDKITEEIQLKLANDAYSKVINKIINNPSLSENLQIAIAQKGEYTAKAQLIHRNELCTQAIEILAKDTEETVRIQLTNRDNLPTNVQILLAKDKNSAVRENIAGNTKIKEVQYILIKDKNPDVKKTLLENNNLDTELRVRFQSKTPKGFSKDEYIAKVNKNKYIFRILEKYMEDNNLSELSYPKNFKGTTIERYYNQPLVNAMFKTNNGKPITKENIQNAIEKMESKEFYILHGDFGSEIQSHADFKQIPRHSFALLFKDIESDPEVLDFMQDIAPSLAHGDHASMGGWGALNCGWVLWKDISKVMKKPAILIEQIQSDWRGLTSKIKSMQQDISDPNNRAASRIFENWIEKHGEDGIYRIQKKLDELIKDYPEKLMAEFLTSSGVRGKTVYITGRDTQQQLVRHKSEKASPMLDIIYDRVPAQFGFRPAEDLPGFLKLERATNYRKQIYKMAVARND